MLTMIANNYYHEPFSKKEIRKQLKYKDIMYGFRDGDKNFANKMFLYMEKDKEIRRMLIDKGFDFNKAKEMSFMYLDIISDGLYSKEFQNMKGKI